METRVEHRANLHTTCRDPINTGGSEGCRTRIFMSREFGKFSAKCREGTHLQTAQKRGLTADGRMDADGLRRRGRHFADEVQRELPVGLMPASDSAWYLRPSASIRIIPGNHFHRM